MVRYGAESIVLFAVMISIHDLNVRPSTRREIVGRSLSPSELFGACRRRHTRGEQVRQRCNFSLRHPTMMPAVLLICRRNVDALSAQEDVKKGAANLKLLSESKI